MVKLSLCLTRHHAMKKYPFLIKHRAMKTYWGEWRYNSTHSQPQNLMEVSGQRHVPAALNPSKILQYPLDKGWVGPRAGVDAVVK